MDTSDEFIEALVSARLERQSILSRPSPPDVLVVLDESVLIRLIGSPEIMHDQLVQVAELGQRPYVSVQVIPASHGANAGLGGGLSIATGDGSAPDVLYMDAVEGQTTEKRSLVRQSAVVFERIRGDALSKSQSRELLLRLAEEKWKS